MYFFFDEVGGYTGFLCFDKGANRIEIGGREPIYSLIFFEPSDLFLCINSSISSYFFEG